LIEGSEKGIIIKGKFQENLLMLIPSGYNTTYFPQIIDMNEKYV